MGGLGCWTRADVTVKMTISDKTSVTLPDKSRCLRQSSVARRLETETRRQGVAGDFKVKERVSKSKRLSKYRRKTENAKERERMKKFNEAFENLRQKLPNRELMEENTIAGEKDTKVSALRSAIQYIKSLQSLVADCDAGTLDQDIYQTSAALDTAAAAAANNKSDTNTRSKKASSSSDRWTNYSQNYLKQKFTPSDSRSSSGAGQGPEPGSPRDVNEISLHISLLDNVNNTQ